MISTTFADSSLIYCYLGASAAAFVHQTHKAPAAAVPCCGGNRREQPTNRHTTAKPLRPVAPHVANAYKYPPTHRLQPNGLAVASCCIAAPTGYHAPAGGRVRHAASCAIQPQPNSRPSFPAAMSYAKPNAPSTSQRRGKHFYPSAGGLLRLRSVRRGTSDCSHTASVPCPNVAPCLISAVCAPLVPYSGRRVALPWPRPAARAESPAPAPAPLQADCTQCRRLSRDAGTAFARRASKSRKPPPLGALCGLSRKDVAGVQFSKPHKGFLDPTHVSKFE